LLHGAFSISACEVKVTAIDAHMAHLDVGGDLGRDEAIPPQ
jgi:hypothetical protein